jgi:hypothetical protein
MGIGLWPRFIVLVGVGDKLPYEPILIVSIISLCRSVRLRSLRHTCRCVVFLLEFRLFFLFRVG